MTNSRRDFMKSSVAAAAALFAPKAALAQSADTGNSRLATLLSPAGGDAFKQKLIASNRAALAQASPFSPSDTAETVRAILKSHMRVATANAEVSGSAAQNATAAAPSMPNVTIDGPVLGAYMDGQAYAVADTSTSLTYPIQPSPQIGLATEGFPDFVQNTIQNDYPSGTFGNEFTITYAPTNPNTDSLLSLVLLINAANFVANGVYSAPQSALLEGTNINISLNNNTFDDVVIGPGSTKGLALQNLQCGTFAISGNTDNVDARHSIIGNMGYAADVEASMTNLAGAVVGSMLFNGNNLNAFDFTSTQVSGGISGSGIFTNSAFVNSDIPLNTGAQLNISNGIVLAPTGAGWTPEFLQSLEAPGLNNATSIEGLTARLNILTANIKANQQNGTPIDQSGGPNLFISAAIAQRIATDPALQNSLQQSGLLNSTNYAALLQSRNALFATLAAYKPSVANAVTAWTTTPAAPIAKAYVAKRPTNIVEMVRKTAKTFIARLAAA